MLKEFKAFVLRGNVVDLAVAVVIGAAFGALVTAFVKDLITPLISIPGKITFGNLSFTINHSTFLYGDFLNLLVSFILIAAAIFFLVVKPINAIQAKRSRGQDDDDPTSRQCPDCLSEVPLAARRCAFCTSTIEPVVTAGAETAPGGDVEPAAT